MLPREAQLFNETGECLPTKIKFCIANQICIQNIRTKNMKALTENITATQAPKPIRRKCDSKDGNESCAFRKKNHL